MNPGEKRKDGKMAIRIRSKGKGYVALCAAESELRDGDLYINDGQHNALSKKFEADFKKMGFWKNDKE